MKVYKEILKTFTFFIQTFLHPIIQVLLHKQKMFAHKFYFTF